MKTPFPEMDPYLEHPALWQDVHNWLIAAIADAIVPVIAPRYYVALERRTYLLKPDDIVFIGRPDIALVSRPQPVITATSPADNGDLDGEEPINSVGQSTALPHSAEEVGHEHRHVHGVHTSRVTSRVGRLSAGKKLDKDGRAEY